MTEIDLILGNLNTISGHAFATKLIENLEQDLLALNQIRNYIQDKLDEKICWDMTYNEVEECNSFNSIKINVDSKIKDLVAKLNKDKK